MTIPRILLLLALLLMATRASAQDLPDDRPRHANGLIYDESAMARLRAVVDSLHGTFDPEGRARRDSLRQAVGTSIRFSFTPGDATDAAAMTALQADLEVGTLPAIVAERYRDHLEYVEGLSPIIIAWCRIESGAREGSDVGTCFELGSRFHFIGDTMLFTHPPRVGTWVFETRPGYDGMDVHALHIAEEFVIRPLPAEYARLVRYAEHLLEPVSLRIDDEADTADHLIDGLSVALREMYALPTDIPPGAMAVVYDGTNPKGTRRYVVNPAYDSALAAQKRRYLPQIALLLRAAPGGVARYPTLRLDSIGACADRQCVLDYIERDVSAALTMELLRRDRRGVRGVHPCMMCDEDQVATVHHAQEIARAAAVAGRWDVFLTAHLRAIHFASTINNAALDPKGTTWLSNLPELEATGLRVPDLLIGLILGGENDLRRIGIYSGLPGFAAPFVESSATADLERRLRTMIMDERLAPQQRADLFALYVKYLNALPDGHARLLELITNAPKYPAYMRDEIEEMGEVMGVGKEED